MMEEAQYVIYEESPSLPSHPSRPMDVLSSMGIASFPNSENKREDITLPQLEDVDSKLNSNQFTIFPNDNQQNSILSLAEEVILPETDKNKPLNDHDSMVANSVYEAVDTSSSYRLFITPVPYSNLVKYNSEDKIVSPSTGETLISKPTGNYTVLDVPVEEGKEWNVSNEISSNVVPNSSLNIKGKLKTSQTQVVVKFLQEDLNFDMVEIISPHLENSHIFEIIENDSDDFKSALQKNENEKNPTRNYRISLKNNDYTGSTDEQQPNVANNNLECPSNITFNCYFCNKLFATENLATQHKKVCSMKYANSSTELPIHINTLDQNVVQKTLNKPDVENNVESLLLWICLICSHKSATSDDLNLHYNSHSLQELSAALLKCTQPTNCRSEKLISEKGSLNEAPGHYKEEINTVECKSYTTAKERTSKDCVTNLDQNIRSDSAKPNMHNPALSSVSESTSNKSNLSNGSNSKISKKAKNAKSKFKVKTGEVVLKSRDPHLCPICKKVLSSRGNLAKHLIQHQIVKPWVCKVCGNGFNSKRDHNYHYMQRHTMLRPNVCNICGKGFANKRTLTEHIVFHKNERDFHCKLCGKSFRTKKCVTRHMQRHETNAKFECNLCFKSFRVKVDFLAHLKFMHNSEKKKKSKPLSTKPPKNINQLKKNLPNHITNSTHTKSQVNHCSLASTFNQTLLPLSVVSSTDQQAHKLKELSEFLQSNSNSLLTDIGNEFHSVSLSESDPQDTLFVNGENVSTQTTVPVTTASEEHVSNNSMYKLPAKSGIVCQDPIDTSGMFVMIGLGEMGRDLRNKKTSTSIHDNGKRNDQNQSAQNQVDMSQRVCEVSLLPTVIEEMSRTYSIGMDHELGKSATAEAAVLPKVTKKVNITKSVSSSSDKSCVPSNFSFKSSDSGQVTYPNSQGLNLDLLSQSLQLDYQQ